MTQTPGTKKKLDNRYLIGLAIASAVNFAAHVAISPFMPDQLPIHWNAAGQIDGYGSKLVVLLLDLLPLVMVLLFRVVPSIDPKRDNYEKFWRVWKGFVVGMTIFFIALSWTSELYAFNLVTEGSNFITIFVLGGLGLLFIILGNYMPCVRQNYTFGAKTPWALDDERTWQRTQRMCGIVFIIIGVTMILMGMLGASSQIPFVVGGSVIGGTVWIYVYSYLVFRGTLR